LEHYDNDAKSSFGLRVGGFGLRLECWFSASYGGYVFSERILAHEKILLFGRKQGMGVQNVLHGTKAIAARVLSVLILA